MRALAVATQETPAIQRALARSGVAQTDTEDLLQVALVAAWEAYVVRGAFVLPEGDREARRAMRGFLATVAYRARADTSMADRALLLVDPPEQDAPSAEGALLAAAELRRPEAATTPERWRVLVADADGEEAPDIAKVERIPVNTVSCRLRLAREDIAEAVKRERAAAAHAITTGRRTKR